MSPTKYCIWIALAVMCATANATTFTFDTAPFAGTNVLNTPGRQIVGGEEFLSFTTVQDVFSLDPAVFGTGTVIHFANTTAPNIPDGSNIIVLETFDNDNNPATPFGAGQAADLIASQITTREQGSSSTSTKPSTRLVYSTDLSSNTADLQILARMLNLTGADGQNALPGFAAANFRLNSAPGCRSRPVLP